MPSFRRLSEEELLRAWLFKVYTVHDGEVVADEPAGNRGPHRDRLDQSVMALSSDRSAGVAAAVGGVGVDLTTGCLCTVEQGHASGRHRRSPKSAQWR